MSRRVDGVRVGDDHVGRADVLQQIENTHTDRTFTHDTSSLGAAKSTIREIADRDVIDHIWEQGKRLKDGYNTLAGEYSLDHLTQCVGYPIRSAITFKGLDGTDSPAIIQRFLERCLRRGIHHDGTHNPSFSHTTEDVDRTLRVYRTVLSLIASEVTVPRDDQ